MTESPGAVLADCYDIVCNGYELGSGSIRIHRRDVQDRVFRALGIDDAEGIPVIADAFDLLREERFRGEDVEYNNKRAGGQQSCSHE